MSFTKLDVLMEACDGSRTQVRLDRLDTLFVGRDSVTLEDMLDSYMLSQEKLWLASGHISVLSIADRSAVIRWICNAALMSYGEGPASGLLELCFEDGATERDGHAARVASLAAADKSKHRLAMIASLVTLNPAHEATLYRVCVSSGSGSVDDGVEVLKGALWSLSNSVGSDGS